MKKIIIVMILLASFAYAHGEEEFDEAEMIIEQKIPCGELSDDELEIIGDYYMEQMHSGEAHERMDGMMGGEGSESLRLMHINMAKSFYCGEHQETEGMMDMMMGRNMQNQITRSYFRPIIYLVIGVLIGLAFVIFKDKKPRRKL